MEGQSASLTQVSRKTLLLLLIATGAVCAAVFYSYLFGGRYFVFKDIGSDTLQLYLSEYASIIGKMRSGDLSFWDANNGFGVNMFMYNMGNPVLMVIYLIGFFFGNAAIPGCLVYIFIGEILGSAVCAYLYLSVLHLDERAKAIASFMYAFNGFLIVWGQHYQFGVICMILPLLLWTIERRLRDPKRWPALAVMTGICVFNSMYLAYMCLVICALYVMVRNIMREKGLRKWFVKTVGCAWPMFLGLGLGMVSFLPSYEAVAGVSSRLSSSRGILERFAYYGTFYSPDYYKTLFLRFISGASQGVSDFGGVLNYYEAPAVFFTSLFVFLFFQYLAAVPFLAASLKNRIIHYATAAVGILGLITMEAGIIMNGFTAPFARYTFLYMPYFLLISGLTLQRIIRERKINLPALVPAAAFLIWGFRTALNSGYHNSRKGMFLLLAVALFMAVLLAAWRFLKKERLQKAALVLLCLSLAVNAWADAYMSFSTRDTLMKTGDTYTKLMYDSSLQETLDGLEQEDTQWYRIEKTFGASYCMDSLIQGYHPVSTYNSTQNHFIQSYVQTFWPSLIYRDQNHYNFPLGMRTTDQAELMGVRYIIARRANQDIEGYKLLRQAGDYYIYKSESDACIASYYDEGKYSEDEGGVTVSYEDRDISADIAVPDEKREGTVNVSVNAEKDGLLFVSIPYENGWEILTDGQEAKTLLAENGFQAVKLTAGAHTVSFRYTCPYVKRGAAATLLSLAVFIALLVCTSRRRRTDAKNAAV